MIFIYADDKIDIIVEPVIVNGKDGGVSITDSDEDLDITFETMDTALAWAKKLTKKLKKAAA